MEGLRAKRGSVVFGDTFSQVQGGGETAQGSGRPLFDFLKNFEEVCVAFSGFGISDNQVALLQQVCENLNVTAVVVPSEIGGENEAAKEKACEALRDCKNVRTVVADCGYPYTDGFREVLVSYLNGSTVRELVLHELPMMWGTYDGNVLRQCIELRPRSVTKFTWKGSQALFVEPPDAEKEEEELVVDLVGELTKMADANAKRRESVRLTALVVCAVGKHKRRQVGAGNLQREVFYIIAQQLFGSWTEECWLPQIKP